MAIGPVTVHAKMLRLKLLRVKADLERALEMWLPNYTKCGLDVLGSRASPDPRRGFMTFPINSTSVMTPACERVCRVMQRVAREGLISYGGVFSCRKIAGTNYWSQHAWGNALDLFPKDSKYNDEIARAAVTQAMKRTFANRGRKLDLSNVIDHLNGRIWTPGTGWHEYNGTVGPHVHVQAAPIKTGTPPCA